MASYPSQDPYSQSGYDDHVLESQMTQEELEEAKESYRSGLQQRIGQLEKQLTDRKHGKDDKKSGKKGHGGSSSKSSNKKSTRHKSSSSGSANMPTYPVGYDPTTTGVGQSSSSSLYQDSSGQQWVWSSSQGWVPVQDEQGASPT